MSVIYTKHTPVTASQSKPPQEPGKIVVKTDPPAPDAAEAKAKADADADAAAEAKAKADAEAAEAKSKKKGGK